MKNIIAFLAICMTSAVMAQEGMNSIANNQAQAMGTASHGLASSYGSIVSVSNPRRRTEGTFYMYDNWQNYAVIHTSDNQKFALRNINLNLQRNVFEARVEGDSIFTFNFNNIDKFIVNGVEFKNYYWNDDNRVYQVIYEGEDLQLLKGFKVDLVEGSANPMLNRANDRYVRKEYYFVREKGKISKFKLKKSKILKLVGGDEGKANEILNYARRNKLSFSKENDVKKILEYSSNGKN